MAGRTRRHKGHQRERKWVVPWRDNSDHAKRLVLDARASEPHRHRDVAARRPHEFSQIAEQIIDAEHQRERLHQALERSTMAEIRSEEHTSELQSLMRISYAVFCLKKKNTTK